MERVHLAARADDTEQQALTRMHTWNDVVGLMWQKRVARRSQCVRPGTAVEQPVLRNVIAARQNDRARAAGLQFSGTMDVDIHLAQQEQVFAVEAGVRMSVSIAADDIR